MRIFIANDSKQTLGGGFTFARNFKKGMAQHPVQFVDRIEECDIYFIPGSTMVLKENVERAKELGKKIVLRVDNLPKDSRNRGTGWSRLTKYAAMADKIVYQSEWARDLLFTFLGAGSIIYNGVDTEIFNTNGRKPKPESYIYSRYNRDESKNWVGAYYQFIEIWKQDKTSTLRIIGNFSDEMVQYHFDFPEPMWDSITYAGVIDDPAAIAEELKRTEVFLAPYLFDACSNSILEARASGCDVEASFTGGSNELLRLEDYSLERMCKEYYELLSQSA